MQGTSSLPIPLGHIDVEAYVDSLLSFATSHDLFQKLCGGVHILDFLTQEPDLYTALIPPEWRIWFEEMEVQDILHLLIRQDLDALPGPRPKQDRMAGKPCNDTQPTWRGQPVPPASLVEYIGIIRRHTLERDTKPENTIAVDRSSLNNGLTRNVAVGMKPKKIHEVGNFVTYIDQLTYRIESDKRHQISHLVDFGSGQNYLGRALASPPYSKKVIAIESKHHNIDGAKNMDIAAKLAKKEKVLRNKKLFRKGGGKIPLSTGADGAVEPTHNSGVGVDNDQQQEDHIQYFESTITGGDLSLVIPQIKQASSPSPVSCEPQLLVISLHSCGNLLHHGLRSLAVNPSVKAVAMVGCCYNLVTERLGPPTLKYPSLRGSNVRLEKASAACDPDGFPMSERLAAYKHEHGEGVRLNITARMMAVQAPQNWTLDDSEAFFTRHFYRALLQRIFVDRGVVGEPIGNGASTETRSPRGWTGTGQPIVLGSLRKSCYLSFTTYVRGAIEKLRGDPEQGPRMAECMDDLTDEDIARYEAKYKHKKKQLSIVWSLMAFSAGVVESIIVVDRWLYLKEHDVVKDCWVEAIFDYEQSPRNLVVVGIKK